MGQALVFALVIVAALILSLGLNALLQPWFARYALARPNARSSHRQPTPQGGGAAVVAATLAVAWIFIALKPATLEGQGSAFVATTAATILLALVGWIDDVRTMSPASRLVLQFAAAVAVVATLPGPQILPAVPLWLERVCLVTALVWIVNLVNFMDGIDWMTVAEVVPIAAALVLLGYAGALGVLPAIVACTLLGATLGFAPYNKPVARLFLGDVGSLPIGLLLGWLLLELAAKGYWAAAILLPLYYLTDATLTLMRRILAGEPFWQAHRTHFYQRATDRGFTVEEIVARVFVTNLVLAGLALAAVFIRQTELALPALAAGAASVGILLVIFARGRGRGRTHGSQD